MQLGELQDHLDTIQAKGSLVAIASDSPEDRDVLVARLGLKFPVISDKDQTIIHAFGVQQAEAECSLPALYVVDAQNKVRLAQVGDNIVDRATSASIADALAGVAEPEGAKGAKGKGKKARPKK